MDAAAELGRNPVSKHQFSLSMEMSRLTRDGTVEPVSQDQIFRRKRGQEKFISSVQLTTTRTGNLTRLMHTLPICDDHVCVCVLSSYLFWTSGLWTYQPRSHRKKVAQDFSTFLLRCLASFFSREGLCCSFPSSTVKSNFVYYHIDLIVLHLLGIFFFL